MLLLCYPRLFGYTFNPLSVYFCFRADGELALMIYEVRNTFGDIHPYVLPVHSADRSAAGIRQHELRLQCDCQSKSCQRPHETARWGGERCAPAATR